jgi:hypothetical protein
VQRMSIEEQDGVIGNNEQKSEAALQGMNFF